MKPYPYQTTAIHQIERFGGRALLALDMGLGKTATCLWWRQRHPEADPALVVCPASAKMVWRKEADRLGFRPLVCEGSCPPKVLPSQLRQSFNLAIINYDILDEWVPWLKQWRPRCLFIDECHFIKNPSAKRTKAVRSIAGGIPYVIATSGTPIQNRPIELFTTLQILRPTVFKSRMVYAHRYCKPRWTPWGWKYDGASHVEELHNLLKSSCMVRFTKEEVMSELPSKVRRVLPLPLSNEDEYKEASESFLSWIEKTNPERLLSAKRAETLVRLGELKRLAARLKLRAVVDWINTWLESYPDEKVVVFAVHQKMVEALKRRLRGKSVVVDGTVPWRQRQRAVELFQEDKDTRIFIGNIRAAGVAITLTVASTLVFCELDWVPANMIQAEDRIHRIGQKKPAWIWWLVAAGTIEEELCKVLQHKQRVVTGVLDGKSRADDLDVYSQLLERLRRRKEENDERDWQSQTERQHIADSLRSDRAQA